MAIVVYLWVCQDDLLSQPHAKQSLPLAAFLN